jgi:hypothetical protein
VLSGHAGNIVRLWTSPLVRDFAVDQEELTRGERFRCKTTTSPNRILNFNNLVKS